MFNVYRFYDNGEYVQDLDMSDHQCSAMVGVQPINEACGGCVGCLFLQATYNTEYTETELGILNGKKNNKVRIFKKRGNGVVC